MSDTARIKDYSSICILFNNLMAGDEGFQKTVLDLKELSSLHIWRDIALLLRLLILARASFSALHRTPRCFAEANPGDQITAQSIEKNPRSEDLGFFSWLGIRDEYRTLIEVEDISLVEIDTTRDEASGLQGLIDKTGFTP